MRNMYLCFYHVEDYVAYINFFDTFERYVHENIASTDFLSRS